MKKITDKEELIGWALIAGIFGLGFFAGMTYCYLIKLSIEKL